MSQQEATINPDGSTTFESDPNSEQFGADDIGAEEVLAAKVDPAFYLLGFAALFILAIGFVMYRQRKARAETEDFFTQLDGEKFNLKLPAAVDEYYAIKEKAIEQGWTPGQKVEGPAATASGPQRVLAQALMKRCIADIPLVTHIQKESPGMNKLYSQSMCSVNQWRSYQAAEAMVTAEVDEVRAEADEVEPGWSGVIWKQAMQYHHMLKQRHEMESKAAAAAAEKKRAEENKILAEKRKIDEKKAKELAAEKAAAELIKAEEREKESKTAFNSGMKKGFLSGKKK